MTHDIFISFSTKDRAVADSLKEYLDGHGTSCWMSAAAIDGGEVWTRAIVDGITGARAMVLLLSANSNASEHVRREIYLARERHLRIIPFRIDDVEPDGDLAYNLAGIQWLQGSGQPTKAEFDRLAQSVRGYLDRTSPPATKAEATVELVGPQSQTARLQELSAPAERVPPAFEQPRQSTPDTAEKSAAIASEPHRPGPPLESKEPRRAPVVTEPPVKVSEPIVSL